jgi:LysR family glycine cleavage system transcriptional activator
MRWLIPRISAFQRQHPDVEIKLTTSTAPVDFEGSGYDIAIRGALQPPRGCRAQAFMTETIVPVCHADLLKRDPLGLRVPADLARQTLIGYATEPYAWADWLKAAGVPGLKPASVLGFEQMYFSLQAAAEGLGVVLVPLFLVADDILGGRLCAPFGTLAAKERNYYASSVGSPDPEPLVDAFCDWLMQEGRATELSINAWARTMGW